MEGVGLKMHHPSSRLVEGQASMNGKLESRCCSKDDTGSAEEGNMY